MAEDPNVRKEELVVTRIIDASVEVVWKAWTEPEQVMHWWGPKYYTSPSCRIDLRVGGRYVFAMQAPEDQGGQTSYTSGVYRRILPMELLEFTQGLSDAEGNRIDPAQAGMPADFPGELNTTVTFRRARRHDGIDHYADRLGAEPEVRLRVCRDAAADG